MILFIECIASCLLFTLLIMPAQLKDPINMIMSYPPAIIKRVEQLPEYRDNIKSRERKHIAKKIVGALFVSVILSVVAYFSGCRDFISSLIHVFILCFSVNLYDLIVLDWGYFCHSKRVRIAGTEDMDKEYKDYFFHVKGAIKGTAITLFMSLLAAGLLHLAVNLIS